MENFAGIGKVDLSGGLGGLYAGIQNRQAMDANDLANVMQAMKLRQQQMESDRYGQMTPLEVQLKSQEGRIKEQKAALADLMTNDPTAMARLKEGELGNSDLAAARGQVALGTAATDIAHGNATNQMNTDLAIASRNLQKLQQAWMYSQQMGPAGEAAFQQAVAQIPDPQLRAIMQKAPPQMRGQLFARLETGLRQAMMSAPKAVAEIEKEDTHGSWQVKVQEMRDRSARALEVMRQNREDSRSNQIVAGLFNRDITDTIKLYEPRKRAILDSLKDPSAAKLRIQSEAVRKGLSGNKAREYVETELQKWERTQIAKVKELEDKVNVGRSLRRDLTMAMLIKDPKKREEAMADVREKMIQFAEQSVPDEGGSSSSSGSSESFTEEDVARVRQSLGTGNFTSGDEPLDGGK